MAAAAAVTLRCRQDRRDHKQEQQGRRCQRQQDNKKNNGNENGSGEIRASYCDVQQQYVRPRIREDLLPHDFALWSNKGGGGIGIGIPSPRSGNVGSFFGPRLCEGSEHLEQLEFQWNCRKQQERRKFSGESMDDWPPSVVANGANGGGIDKAIYQNLVEMIPLMESFMEQKGNRRQAAMVYTPTPARDGLFKKVSESPLNSKKNKQQRPVNNTKQQQQQQQLDAEETPPVWVEQENILRRVEEDSSSAAEKLDREKLMQLQGEIDALHRKLQEKDGMLRACESDARAEAARQEDIHHLKTKVQELQQKLWDGEQTSQSLESQLTEKQQELANTQSLVERMQIQLLKKNNAVSSMAEELNELRMQVAAFQYQAQLRNLSIQDQEEELVEDSEDGYDDVHVNDEDDEQARCMEEVRRMYLGAVIAAKENPGAESIILAAELRRRLQSFVPMSLVC